jgi:hypothetical protein
MMPNSQLADVVRSEPGFEDALGLCVGSLRRMAEYELDDAVNRRMQQLGERKEFLNEDEHAELLSLVEFSERRTREKLDARLALQRLGELLPELVKR